MIFQAGYEGNNVVMYKYGKSIKIKRRWKDWRKIE
jgi:hypothetical protein